MNLDPRKMSDLEAGVHYLAQVGRIAPGITIGQLVGPEALAGDCKFYDLICQAREAGKTTARVATRVAKKVGDVTASTVRKVGDFAGAAVRVMQRDPVVATVEKVAEGIRQGGGKAEVVDEAVEAPGAGKLIEEFGKVWKELVGQEIEAQEGRSGLAKMGMTGMLPWLIGGGVVLFLVGRKPSE